MAAHDGGRRGGKSAAIAEARVKHRGSWWTTLPKHGWTQTAREVFEAKAADGVKIPRGRVHKPAGDWDRQ
jgi:hypothetical protein